MLTSRYVLTWKRQSDGSRIMKCRLCVHGFKDIDRDVLDSFSGTSTRWGQRMIVALSVQSGGPLVSMDISQAFLKGLTGFYRLMYGTVNGHPHYVARSCRTPESYGSSCTYIWYSGYVQYLFL